MLDYTHLRVEKKEQAVVVQLRDAWVQGFTVVEEVGQELTHVLADETCKRVVLDLQAVEFLSSAALGKLISFNAKLDARAGWLRLCNLQRPVHDVFVSCKLNYLFQIKKALAEALQEC